MTSQAFDMAEHEERLDRVIARSFSTTFMSNSKWRRLFSALAATDPAIRKLRWKFVGRDAEVEGAAPDAECLGGSYVTRTSFAAFPYKEIEWVELPDLSDLPQSVAAVGKFEATQTPTGVRIYGYR